MPQSLSASRMIQLRHFDKSHSLNHSPPRRFRMVHLGVINSVPRSRGESRGEGGGGWARVLMIGVEVFPRCGVGVIRVGLQIVHVRTTCW